MTPLELLALVTLPVGLSDIALADLAALWLQCAPRDAYERLLTKRILQAAARLELSAQREPLEINSLWLRYESAADRILRQSLNALERYRRDNPIPIALDEPAPTEPQAARPESTSQPTRETASTTESPRMPAPDRPRPAPESNPPARRRFRSLEHELMEAIRDPDAYAASLTDAEILPIAITPTPPSPVAPSSG